MKKIIDDLTATIEKYNFLLVKIHEEAFSQKPHPAKWSKKEELGHLIDSAQNNIQRFIRVQYQEKVHILYHPDNWVHFNDYQNANLKDMVLLWHLLNKQICSILLKMGPEHYEKLIDIGHDLPNNKTTLFIAEDYVEHMRHHLESIFAI
jgi:hypothetical protein